MRNRRRGRCDHRPHVFQRWHAARFGVQGATDPAADAPDPNRTVGHMVTALRSVFRQPGYVIAALSIAAAIGALLVWSSAIITVYPTGGVFIDADLLTLATIVLTWLLLAVSLPLHWYAWRRSVGSARARGTGGLAALLSVSSLSCCAPLLIPGVLSLVGVIRHVDPLDHRAPARLAASTLRACVAAAGGQSGHRVPRRRSRVPATVKPHRRA